jgi:hypothetical protein
MMNYKKQKSIRYEDQEIPRYQVLAPLTVALQKPDVLEPDNGQPLIASFRTNLKEATPYVQELDSEWEGISTNVPTLAK